MISGCICPALKRVRPHFRPPTNPALSSALNSPFEDFTITELNKFTYSYVREEEVDGVMMGRYRSFSRVMKKSGYTKQDVLGRSRNFFKLEKFEFFDRGGQSIENANLVRLSGI